MAIVALEGPDCCGKTTLWGALRERLPSATFVPRMSHFRELVPAMSFVERRQEELWHALYDPSRLYVCDRHVAVSAPVYDAVYDRPLLVDWRRWLKELYVVYITVPLAELERRHKCRGDEFFDVALYNRVLLEYDAYMQEADGCYLDGTLSNEEQLDYLLGFLHKEGLCSR